MLMLMLMLMLIILFLTNKRAYKILFHITTHFPNLFFYSVKGLDAFFSLTLLSVQQIAGLLLTKIR